MRRPLSLLRAPVSDADTGTQAEPANLKTKNQGLCAARAAALLLPSLPARPTRTLPARLALEDRSRLPAAHPAPVEPHNISTALTSVSSSTPTVLPMRYAANSTMSPAATPSLGTLRPVSVCPRCALVQSCAHSAPAHSAHHLLTAQLIVNSLAMRAAAKHNRSTTCPPTFSCLPCRAPPQPTRCRTPIAAAPPPPRCPVQPLATHLTAHHHAMS